jgi:cell filamentation protein
MARGTSDDPYVYPGTDVLKNHLGIRTAKALSDAEAIITTTQLARLERSPVKGSFDISHYADTHHAIFKAVYPFAGEFRTTELHKWSEQRQEYTTFMPAEVAVPWLNRHLNEEVGKRGTFREFGRDEFVERSTRLYLDLNAFHPFREGNGRTQREFIRTLGLNAGYEIDWRRLDKTHLLEATIKTAFDRTKKDHSLHNQVSLAIVNPTKNLELQRAWDRYASGAADFTPPPSAGIAESRATLPNAIRASARAAPGPTAFASSSWETESRIRVYSADALLHAVEKVHLPGSSPSVYAVLPDGTIRNTATQRDEYLRIDAGRSDYPTRLQQAADRHFGQSRDVDQPGRGRGPRDPDVNGP